jgi:hypothetical protein
MQLATEPYALLLAPTARERFSVSWGLAESGATGPAGKRCGDPAGHIARSSADLFPALLQFIFPARRLPAGELCEDVENRQADGEIPERGHGGYRSATAR